MPCNIFQVAYYSRLDQDKSHFDQPSSHSSPKFKTLGLLFSHALLMQGATLQITLFVS